VSEWDVHSDPFREGIRLFNQAEFYDAHEVLEDVWRGSSGPEKKFLQALIQLAVALHHHSKGNLRGARSLLARSARNLKAYPAEFHGIAVGRVLHEISEWESALHGSKPLPPHPKL
jgi:predicted metal-dependent hydrolase